MKRIIAFIRPNMLEDVIFALHGIEGFPGASISEVQDIGSGVREPREETDRTPFHGFAKFIRMEIVCACARADEIVETIQHKAHTGLPDDGTIGVSTVDLAVSIGTGARGEDVG